MRWALALLFAAALVAGGSAQAAYAVCGAGINTYHAMITGWSPASAGYTSPDGACEGYRTWSASAAPTYTWTIQASGEYTCLLKRVVISSGAVSYVQNSVAILCGQPNRDGYGTNEAHINSLIAAGGGGGGGGGTTTYTIDNDLFRIDEVGGAQIAGAILLCWAAGFAFRALIQTLRKTDDT